MAGWTSLSGYLFFKPGGALGRLKSRKRMWCVLDESTCQLLYFKSEEDARSKPAAGHIVLKGAAITLDLDNQNQFVIIVDGKDFVLTAENHESMMIWLMALQAKRDLHAKARTEKQSEVEDFDRRERSSSDITAANRQREHKPLGNTKSLQTNAVNGSQGLNINQDWRHYQLQKIGESIDSSAHRRVRRNSRMCSMVIASGKLVMTPQDSSLFDLSWFERQKVPISTVRPYNRQLSISMDACGPLSQTLRNKNNTFGDSSSGSTADSDEVFGDDDILSKGKSKGDNWRKTLQKKLRKDSDHDCDPSNVECFQSEERNRNSSLSTSSDSAIDKGETVSQELVVRVTDLEKELIATKCELAKVMNRQTCYQEILKQKDEIIVDLDDKLGQLGQGDQAYDSKRRTARVTKETEERVRVLQNQNRFLNEEVRRLAKLRTSEQSHFHEQDGRLHGLEAEIEKWKLDYVSLIQSSIRFTGTDTMDDAELSLFGGDRHKKRVQNLLDEARKINPSLPTYEGLANRNVHVDCYGFKHQYEDTGLLLHYLCQELSHHYLTQAGTYEEHQHRWLLYLRQQAKCLMKNKKELKHLCRGGIPDQYRKQVWRQLVHSRVQDIITEKGPHYFRNLCNMVPDSPLAARYRKQVSLDLMRTMPSNVKFATAGSRGIMDLQDVLLAFCIHSPTIGYCQGMNFIVGMALLFMDAQDAFWTLVAITERYFTSHYFDHNLIGAQADQHVLKDIIHDKLPQLFQHLEEIDIEVSTVTLNWFLAIFFDAVPFQTLLRVWDSFLLEGPKVLFRFSVAMLKMHEKEILIKTDTISVMRHLKASAKITYDIDGLVKVAFEDLKPFPPRQNIMSKQTCYLNTLKEKHKRREIQKLAFAEREHLFMALEAEAGNYLSFECCAAHKNGEIWLCYGEQNLSKVCKVKSDEGVMIDLNLEFDTRVMCMIAVSEDLVIFGTLSWMVYAYNTKTREQVWHTRLHDAVLSLCDFNDDDTPCRVFAGLADGTVAVIEDLFNENPTFDVLYIPIAQSPVMCVRLLDTQLWCACGNKVFIIHAGTLDAMDNFTVSSNPYDHILSLEPGIPGVWISIRGSSILELWDSKTLNCKMLYDTRGGHYPNLRKEDDSYFNKARITAILPHEHTVWIGTGEGNLIIYDVVEHIQSVTPSEASFSADISDSILVSRTKDTEVTYDPVRAVEERVRELYFHSLNNGESMLLHPKRDEGKAKERVSGHLKATSSTLNHKIECNAYPSTNSTIIGNDENDFTEFTSNKVLSSTPAVNPDRHLDEQADSLQGRELCQSSLSFSPDSFWFDSCGKSFSHNELNYQADLSSQSRGHFLNREEDVVKSRRELFPDTKEPNLGADNDNQVSTNSSLKSDNLSENETGKMISTPKPLCNGDIAHEVNISELSDISQGKDTDLKQKTVSDTFCRNYDVDHERSIAGCSNCLKQMDKKSGDDDNVKTVSMDEEKCERSIDSTSISVTSGNTTFKNQSVDVPDKELNSDIQADPKSLQFDSGVRLGSDASGSTVSSVTETASISKLKNETDESHFANITSASSGMGRDSAVPGKEQLPETNELSKDKNFDSECASTNSTTNISQNVNLKNDSSLKNNDSIVEETLQDGKPELCIPAASEESVNCNNSFKDLRRMSSVKKSSEKIKGNDSQASSQSNRTHFYLSDSEDDVFQDAIESPTKLKNAECGDSREATPNKQGEIISSDVCSKLSSLNTETGAVCNVLPNTSKARSDSGSSSMENIQPKNPDTQWRLEFTGIHVDTDVESMISSMSVDNSEGDSFSLPSGSHRPSVDSQSDLKQFARQNNNSLSTFNPENFIFPEDFSLEQKMAKFLETPSFGTPHTSQVWSSYDEISTPSRGPESSEAEPKKSTYLQGESLRSDISQATSSVSLATMAESLYTADLYVQAKVKISDKPVKCLLSIKYSSEPIILSLSGSYGDDEAVLKWKKEVNEMLWTNDPVLEFCLDTNSPKLPTYMRARMSSTSSAQSNGSCILRGQRLSQSSQ